MSWSRESGWCGGNRAQRPVSACSPWVPCTRRARHPPMPAAPAADESNIEMVRPAGFEPATSASAGQRSIHLSYGRDKREYERPAPRWKRLVPLRDGCGHRARVKWRREGDSNPRYVLPYTRFPVVHLQPLGHLSAKPIGGRKGMAEREGFEPPRLSPNGFQDRRLRPLGHLSARRTGRPREKARPGTQARPMGAAPFSPDGFF